MQDIISEPILNNPYDPPSRHYVLGPNGPTGEIKDGRRPSESFIPIAASRKGANNPVNDGVQELFDFDTTGERRERNILVNELRADVERWRRYNYEHATPISKKLLWHWASRDRENRVLFGQREAAETAIFLTEISGRHGYTDWRIRLKVENEDYNSGLPRVAMKMATGSGKTVVMAMLIAWQTLNKVYGQKNDARFTKRFLLVAPGVTIRDRLRVLMPSDSEDYYTARDLIPADLKQGITKAEIVIHNYHAFMLRDVKEIKGVSTNTRKILRAGNSGADPFKETPDMMVARVLRGFSASSGKTEIMVFNDEAHHCYQDKPVTGETATKKLSAEAKAAQKEAEEANAEARVWFTGLQAIAKKVGVKQIFDLSATPFFLSGSGYNEGYLFPWTVSDFSLMDAIESGIVKIPRTPVDDDSTSQLVTYLNLWDHITPPLPKTNRGAPADSRSWVPPTAVEGALTSLYRSYETTFQHWEEHLKDHGEPPPVFIVVCPNTVVSKLVFEWIGGLYEAGEAGTPVERSAGNLELFRNTENGRPLRQPRTILVDSKTLESGEALSADFRQAASAEIETFKREWVARRAGADVANITDEDILREVMNTVGKKGKLGAEIRCVVSVSMLTEGWDANTVTHILGIRPFRSQLLCEQVIGRGLRRRSYVVADDGKFEPEYANVYGIPFAFIPSDKTISEELPKPPALEVAALEERDHLAIDFPHVSGYRVEIPDAEITLDTSKIRKFVISKDEIPTWTETFGIIGEGERQVQIDPASIRSQQVAYTLAGRVLKSHFTPLGEDSKPWLFPRLVHMLRQWLDAAIELRDGLSVGHLMLSTERLSAAGEAFVLALAIQSEEERTEHVLPVLRSRQPTGATNSVYFMTRKPAVETLKSHVSHVVLDGKGGNTWEQTVSEVLEDHRDVYSYVKNDHLGFVIPYLHKGRSYDYIPDFLVRLRRLDGEDFDRTLIIEVSGGQKSPGPTKAKADTARHSWCAAVNNHGGFGLWAYLEVTTMLDVGTLIDDAIAQLLNHAERETQNASA